MRDKVTIKIPRELYENLQEMVVGTGFSSVTEFIVFVMRTLASCGPVNEDSKLSEEEITAIKKRLEKLGYI
ncbi:MAG: hypothetical protein XD72_2062 [Methanothrix harundinacea]|jgi:Arc/MetJ-type ribon-helix-helix transcriptional regulator|uniref:CopG family transcriptional regulator n=1 Tax=Methanothrix harundinacea TaxID=301375 RepID=A0A101FSJ3_9EURY|nr:MAG: hypothetical protein XD72_2062 [Methanothrix harundinacea]